MSPTTRRHRATEACARVRIDALLKIVRWNLTDGASVLLEHTLPDGSRADYKLCDRAGRPMALVEAKYDLHATEAPLPRRIGRMPDTCNYPAEIERDEDGRYVVTFPDFGWGATDGATRDEALAEAKDLLRELIATTIREGKDLPGPSRASKRRPLVVPPVQIA